MPYSHRPYASRISIHALREEGDILSIAVSFLKRISIHALREEGDDALFCHDCTEDYFYPRPPRGGRLPRSTLLSKPDTYFYPRPPRGGRRILLRARSRHGRFLSTPSARRATHQTVQPDVGAIQFLSTPSARRATVGMPQHVGMQRNFYPRPPRGGRRDDAATVAEVDNFYPRPPRGGRRREP